MNIIDILKGIENLVVQLLLLIIYIPKTIIKIIRDPSWVPGYISEENAKTPRYLDYVSPVLLYLIIALVPYAIFPDKSTLKPDPDSIITALQSSEGMVRGIIFMAIPMSFAFFIELFRSNTFSRVNIERLLYIQCYFFTPFIFAIQIRWLLSILYSDSTNSCLAYIINFVIITVCVATLIWLVFVQWKFLKEELSSKIAKVLKVLIISLILIIFITSPITDYNLLKELVCSGVWRNIYSCDLGIKCFVDLQPIGILITLIVLIIYGYAFIMRLLSWNKQRTVKKSSDAEEPLI